MRKSVVLQHLKRTMSVNDAHYPIASYTEGKRFRASLWPATKTDQREGRAERSMLFTRRTTELQHYDLLKDNLNTYRIIGVRIFPHHTEALIEREPESA